MSQVDLAAIISDRREAARLRVTASASSMGAVVTACVDGRHGSAEMARGAVPAVFGYGILDERAIVLYDPPLLTEFPAHPFVAEGEGAGAARVAAS